MSYKTIRIKKKGGGSRLQRVQVLKSGKYRFVRNPKSKVRSTKTETTRKTKRSVGKLARRKRRRRARDFTLPIAPIAGFAVGVAPAVEAAINGNLVGHKGSVEWLAHNYLGYSVSEKNWAPERMLQGLVPLVLGGLIHKYVGGKPLNINRMLAQAGVPFLRV